MYINKEIERFAEAEGKKRGLDVVIISTSPTCGWMSVVDGKNERNYSFPKNGINEKWILKKLNDFLNIKNSYINLSEMMEKIVGDEFNAYPTSYGIGINNIFSLRRDEIMEKIENFFKIHNIKYKIRVSEGRFVLKIEVSKAKENLKRINEAIKNLKGAKND